MKCNVYCTIRCRCLCVERRHGENTESITLFIVQLPSKCRRSGCPPVSLQLLYLKQPASAFHQVYFIVRCWTHLVSLTMFVSFFPLLQEKCAQYWPIAEEREMAFRDTRFLVTLLSEDTKSYYTTRVLELLNISVGWNIIYHKGNSQWKVVKENWNVYKFSRLNISHGPLLFEVF